MTKVQGGAPREGKKVARKLRRSTAVNPGDPDAAARIISAAVLIMTKQGYHGTSVREIADLADVSIATLYHHFGSKDELLAEIMTRGTIHLHDRAEAVVEQYVDDPVERFLALTGMLVDRHLRARPEAFLGSTEFRSLTGPARRRIVGMRDSFQRMFENAVIDGVEQGAFTTAYPRDAARAVITMCTAVAGWYKESGPLSVTEIVERYQTMCLGIVGHVGELPSARPTPGRARRQTA